MAATATMSRLLHPIGTTQNSQGTVSYKKWGKRTVTLSVPLSHREEPNPYGGLPVQLRLEVVSTDGDQVLVMRQSSHGAIPNDYFVCSGKGGDLVFLPPVLDEDFLPGSMALLDCRDGNYLVAHLSVTHNQNTGLITEGTLHLCKYNASSRLSSKWTHESVTLPLPNLTNWHNHRVIPFNGTDLMWVDFKQGMLRMSLSDGKPSSFQFVGLPNELSSISTKYWRDDRPEMFRSVGCCNHKVQLVNLHIPEDSTTNTVAVDIWTLDLGNGNWSKDYNNVSLKCSDLWASNFRKLPWPNSVPISPLLRDDNNSTILCLTVVEQKNKNKKAWLLQIDMQTKILKEVTGYPHYYSHMKQPFLINSSSVTSKRTMILWPF